MKKRNNYVILVVAFIFLTIFTACYNINSEKNVIRENKHNKDFIQLWYNIDDELYYNIIKDIKDYCERNNIFLDTVKFDDKTLSYEDYIFKRNLASEKGNMIIIDDILYISDLAKSHADYTKLKNYNNLLDPYKNRFCIPIGRALKSSFIDNGILQYYNINLPKKSVITYVDYLELKQEMKKRGARFEPKNEDFYETVKYFLNSNGLLYINKRDEIFKNNNNLKKLLKKTIYDICNDIVIYDNIEMFEIEELIKIPFKGFEIYDIKSSLYLKKWNIYDSSYKFPMQALWFENKYMEETFNKTFIIDYFGVDYFNLGKSLSLFLYKKITSEKVYDLANYILDQSSYVYGRDKLLISAPVLYTDKVLEELKLNKNLEYMGKTSEHNKKIINDTFDIFAKDEVKSKEIADAYFTDITIVSSIETLIYDTIHEIAEKLSEGKSRDELYLENFDSENEEINKLVDSKIDEFIKQLILQIN